MAIHSHIISRNIKFNINTSKKSYLSKIKILKRNQIEILI